MADDPVEITWNGDQVLAAARDASAEGIKLALEHLLGVSRQLVPIETATLERSGTVTVDRAERVGAVSYDTPYAVRQHEDMTLRHDEGRTAKYLENPMHTEGDTMAAILAREGRRRLGG